MSAIEELVTAYAELEERVHSRISEMSGTLCGDCETPCCKPEHCCDVFESAWLRVVAEKRGASLPNDIDDVNFLGQEGCTLPAGWPPQCTWYVCDSLETSIRDPLTRYVYQVLCSVLGYVIRSVTRDRDLVDYEDLSEITDRQRTKLMRRIHEASECADRAWLLLQERETSKPVAEAAENILFIARRFPFAARPVRFEGEAPSLSRASRSP